jgi:hypothetical protein
MSKSIQSDSTQPSAPAEFAPFLPAHVLKKPGPHGMAAAQIY